MTNSRCRCAAGSGVCGESSCTAQHVGGLCPLTPGVVLTSRLLVIMLAKCLTLPCPLCSCADMTLTLPQARFITIKHQVKEDANWRKVYMWELAAYPAGGRWGPAPPAVPQTVTYRNLMGVNGIWGWGSQTFSDTAVKAGVGPLLYKDVGYGGRNYQRCVCVCVGCCCQAVMLVQAVTNTLATEQQSSRGSAGRPFCLLICALTTCSLLCVSLLCSLLSMSWDVKKPGGCLLHWGVEVALHQLPAEYEVSPVPHTIAENVC